MLKSVSVALATNFTLPVFVWNYRRAKIFLAQDAEKLEVILNFWQIFAHESIPKLQIKDDNEANNPDQIFQNYQLKIGKTFIEYQMPATLVSTEKVEKVFCRVEEKAIEANVQSAKKQNSKSFFSPRSPSPNREIVFVSGSVSCFGEALPSSRSVEKNQILVFSQTNLDDHSDPSIEEICQSPGKKESPQTLKQRLTSIKKPIFSSTKKTQQFETPKLSGN